MSKRKKPPFDSRGGVIVMSRLMIESPAYSSLPAQAKVLMMLLQTNWRDDRPVAFGVREASKKIPCSLTVAGTSFKTLEDRGFITRESESFFNSKTGSKTRDWLLTWMPYQGKLPRNLWENWPHEK